MLADHGDGLVYLGALGVAEVGDVAFDPGDEPRKRCTHLSQIAVLDKSHSGWPGAPRPYLGQFTPGVSSIPVKDGGRGGSRRRAARAGRGRRHCAVSGDAEPLAGRAMHVG